MARAGSRGVTGARGSQGPVGPSDGFAVTVKPQQNLSAGDDTQIAQLSLTVSGSYIVTATTSLAGNASNNLNLASCTLLQNANPVAQAAADAPPGPGGLQPNGRAHGRGEHE